MEDDNDFHFDSEFGSYIRTNVDFGDVAEEISLEQLRSDMDKLESFIGGTKVGKGIKVRPSSRPAAVDNPIADGIRGTANSPVAESGSKPRKRNRSGYANVGQGRPRKRPAVGRSESTPATSDANGSNGEGNRGSASITPLHTISSDESGPIPGRENDSNYEQYLRLRRELERRRELTSNETASKQNPGKGRGRRPIKDRLGNRNTARQIAPEFDEAIFYASIRDIRFTSSGDGELKITIPYELRAEAKKFVDSYGLDLHFHVTRRNYGTD